MSESYVVWFRERGYLREWYEVPLCDTHGRFFDIAGRMASTVTSLADVNAKVDESAVFSVLQFGAIIPPLSPWQGIRRFLPGYRYFGTELDSPVELSLPTHIPTLDPERQSDEIERVLDTVLKHLVGDQQNPVLLFSGGVDSGIIASRLAALEYRDCLLLNYSFRETDPESELAEAMAKTLGLQFERVSAKRDLCDCLIKPGRVYPQPFGDHSTVSTSDLAHTVVDRLSGQQRLILDGTGADGAFGMINKINIWNRVVRIPTIIKKIASLVYDAILWRRTGTIEYISRIFRRSIDMPLLSAVLAQNPLAGTFYRNLARSSVDQLLAEWVGSWGSELLSKRIVAADLALIGANIFAQKSQPILESAGHRVAYPFLDTQVVKVAMASIPYWQMDEPKAPLKRSLARHVPRDMVYRPKSGFVDPHRSVFINTEFIAHLRAAADQTSPIASVVESKYLIKACDLLSRKKKLPVQTLNCLWAITFTDRWYRTAR